MEDSGAVMEVVSEEIAVGEIDPMGLWILEDLGFELS